MGRVTERKRVERSRIVRTLSELGPLSTAELPYSPSRRHRQHFLNRFHVPERVADGTSSVYYLRDEHTPQQVLEHWADVNHDVISMDGNAVLHRAISEQGTEWRDASRELFGPFQSENHVTPDDVLNGESRQGGTCSLCGEEYPRYLRDHLPCND